MMINLVIDDDASRESINGFDVGFSLKNVHGEYETGFIDGPCFEIVKYFFYIISLSTSYL
jgi:hypothetical protein